MRTFQPLFIGFLPCRAAQTLSQGLLASSGLWLGSQLAPSAEVFPLLQMAPLKQEAHLVFLCRTLSLPLQERTRAWRNAYSFSLRSFWGKFANLCADIMKQRIVWNVDSPVHCGMPSNTSAHSSVGAMSDTLSKVH